jgi:hypothetical protein
MNFKLWLERNFVTLSPAVKADVEKIAALLYRFPSGSKDTILGYLTVDTTNQRQNKLPAAKQDTSYKKIKIQTDANLPHGAAFVPPNTVYVHPTILKDPEKFKSLLYHELIHAKDPETNNNVKYLNPEDGHDQYYKQRAEFNAGKKKQIVVTSL